MSNTHHRSARNPASVLVVPTSVTATVTMMAAMTSGWRAPRRASGAGSGRSSRELDGGAAAGGGGAGAGGGGAAEGGGGAPVTGDQRRTGPGLAPVAAPPTLAAGHRGRSPRAGQATAA